LNRDKPCPQILRSFGNELVSVIDDSGLPFLGNFAELEANPETDFKGFEIAVDNLGHQPDSVIELGDADGIRGLVRERVGRNPDDGIRDKGARLSKLHGGEFSGPAFRANETRRETDKSALRTLCGFVSVSLGNLAPVS
jgi:hypothetical protein